MSKQKFGPDDFIVVLKPQINNEDAWTGEVTVSIVTSDENNLDDEDYYGMMHFTRLLCGSIPAMDRNDTFKQACEKEANLHLPNDEKCASNKITSIDDNVITLNFTSETEGNS